MHIYKKNSQFFHVLHSKSNCFATLEPHDVNLIVRLCIVTDHTDLILHYFLDQIKMMFCSFSNFLQIWRSFATPQVKSLIVKLRLLSTKTPILECFSINRHCLQYRLPNFSLTEAKLLRPPSHLLYHCLT